MNYDPRTPHDLVVIGSGAAGMAAAISAHHFGLRPLIVEKTAHFGGSTAVSGGAIWIPDNPIMRKAGMTDDVDAAKEYILSETGNRGEVSLIDAFLQNGPKAISFFNESTALKFSHRAYSPDYHSDQPGAALGGRVIDALDYDGRRLGSNLQKLRPPIGDFTLFGGMMLNRFDIGHFLKMSRSPASAWHATKLVGRYARDLVSQGRATRLVLGAAIAGRMGEELIQRKIPILFEAELVRLEKDDVGRVVAAHVQGSQGTLRLDAPRGVVLAAGGYAHDRTRREQTFEHVREGIAHYSMSPTAGEGQGIRAAEAAGADFVTTNSNPAFWTPVSLLPNGDGTKRPFPHLFLDRAKPGVVAVGANGRRFANEASSYHDFVQALVAMLTETGTKSAWLLADRKALRRYGLGAVPAFPGRVGPYLRSGYLKQADSIDKLADAIGVNVGALTDTIARTNADASKGVDDAFGKGGSQYQTYLGDAENKPNPCLRPLDHPPYFAVEIFPGDIGTSMGLRIDPDARVLDREGHAIPRLFACGNDANSIMAGAYPGAGITLGPALTFGYVAGKTAAIS